MLLYHPAVINYFEPFAVRLQDLLHQHTEAEAMIGDPAAQTWLGKRYFWGLGGLQPDEEQVEM